MKKVFVLVAFALIYWLSCSKTPTEVAIPCVRTFDTLTTIDKYIETDSLSPYKDGLVLELKLRIVNIARQSGTCDVIPLCNNFMTIKNLTDKTVTIYYNIVGGVNVSIRPYESKYEVVPSGAIPGSIGSCFTFMDMKKSMKVRYN
jgi:hypothetical protein